MGIFGITKEVAAVKRHMDKRVDGKSAQIGSGATGSGRSIMRATAKVLGMPSQTLESWVRQAAKGQLAGAGAKPVSAEQMELTRLKTELARVKMERDILNAGGYSPSH